MTEHLEPHDGAVERNVLAACLLAREPVEAVAELLEPQDFYEPAHQAVFRAILALHADGEVVDPFTVADRLPDPTIVGPPNAVTALTGLMAEATTPANAPRYARIILAHSRRRTIMRAARAAVESCAVLGDPDEVTETLSIALADVGSMGDESLPPGLTTVQDFLDRPFSARADWVVPDLVRRDWRVVIVAPEGVGKSVVLRALAAYTAQGVHPFTARDCTPVRVLIVDLENPDEPLDDTLRAIDKGIGSWREREPERAWLWREPAGLDIRNRADRRRMERVFQHTRPDLVCLGPAYKLFTPRRGEDHEQAAHEVLSCLDNLRTRYRFGLVMEQHAPHGDGGKHRDLRPFGSSAWLRWPELGISLNPNAVEPGDGWRKGDLLEVGRWRGDRVDNVWPDWLIKQDHLLWTGHYDAKKPES